MPKTIWPDKEQEHRVSHLEPTDKSPLTKVVVKDTPLIHDKQRHSRIITSSSKKQGDRKNSKTRKDKKKGRNGRKKRGKECSIGRLSR